MQVAALKRLSWVPSCNEGFTRFIYIFLNFLWKWSQFSSFDPTLLCKYSEVKTVRCGYKKWKGRMGRKSLTNIVSTNSGRVWLQCLVTTGPILLLADSGFSQINIGISFK